MFKVLEDDELVKLPSTSNKWKREEQMLQSSNFHQITLETLAFPALGEKLRDLHNQA